MRQTVSVDGDDDAPVLLDGLLLVDAPAAELLLEPLELQPAMASAAAATPAAAPSAADLFLSPTAGTPSASSAGLNFLRQTWRDDSWHRN
jgi:hypothetical protein